MKGLISGRKAKLPDMPAKGRAEGPNRMNKLESAYAAELELYLRAAEVLWDEFEPIKLRLAAKTFYTPDFAVMASDHSPCRTRKGTRVSRS